MSDTQKIDAAEASATWASADPPPDVQEAVLRKIAATEPKDKP